MNKRGLPFQLQKDPSEQIVVESQADCSKVLLSNRSLTSFPREALYNAATSYERKGGGKDAPDRWWLEEDIKYIDLSHNLIPSIPEQISSLAVSLTVLILSNNRLNSLPESICELASLKKLDVTHNSLVSLPTSLGRLISLVELNITGNKTLKLLPDLNGLSSLEVLRCADCSLTTLPASLGIGSSCIKLIELDASGNLLSSLPLGIGSCIRMRILRLSRNKLCDLPDLQRLQNCCVIDLRQNLLTHIPCLPQSQVLSEVFLGANKLTTLQPVTNLVRSGISVLDVASNAIDSLPDEVRFCNNLTTLDVSNNDLNVLPAWIGFMPLLTRLVVDGNPLRTMKKSLISNSSSTSGGVPALKTYLRTRASQEETILFEKEITAVQTAKHQIGIMPIHSTSTSSSSLPILEQYSQVPRAAAAAAANDLTLSQTNAWSLAIREAMSTPSMKLIVSPAAFPAMLKSFSLSDLSQGVSQDCVQRFKALIVDGHALTPEGIPKDLLTVCVNVSEISFSRNALERVPDAVTYSPAASAASLLGAQGPTSIQLQTLRLSFNSISSNGVPWLAPSLVNLDLSHNRLKRIPKCLTLRGLPYLESLTLSNNDIEAPLEEDLGPEGSGDALLWLPKLRSLNLGSNALTRIPQAVLGLSRLSSLDISNCEISSLQPHIGCLPSLIHLNIEGNPQRGVRQGVIDMGTSAILGFLKSRVAVGDERKFLNMFEVKEDELTLQPSKPSPQQQNQYHHHHHHQQQQQQQQQMTTRTTTQIQAASTSTMSTSTMSQASLQVGMTGDYYKMVRRIEELQNELQIGGISTAQLAATKRELLLLRAAESRARQQSSAGF
jgi:Leucine-rich repeat (LRR) protein